LGVGSGGYNSVGVFMSLEPRIEELLLLAQSAKGRVLAAKKVRDLSPNVPLEKLSELIRVLSKDPDSLEFSELAISLAMLLERMQEDKAIKLLEEMLGERNTRLLLGMVLGVIKASKIDIDTMAELIRRLVFDEDDEVRNSALGALRNNLSILGKDFLIELLSDAFSGKDKRKKEGGLILLSAFADKIPPNLLSEFILIALEAEEDIRLKALEILEFVLKDRLPRKTIKEILQKAINEGSESVKKEALKIAKDLDLSI